MVVKAGGRGPAHVTRSLGTAVFDYYVDPVSGSDVAAGTLSAPLATLSRAITLIGASTNKRVGLKCGTTLRNDPVSPGAAGTYIGAYGSGAAPQFFGSSQIAVSSFTKVGNLYSLSSHTYDPFTLALVDSSGNATKLLMTTNSGTVSAADPAVEGEWTWFPGTHATPNVLKFFTAATITGYQVEVPQSGAARTGIAFTANNCGLNGINIRYWSGSGTTVGGNNMLWTNVVSSYNGGDGIDANQASKDFVVTGCTANYNGQRRGAGNGPGDGFSAHSGGGQFATGTIERSTFIGNTQTGVGNQAGCQVTTRYCYFGDNQNDLFVYNVADALIGSHTFEYNVIVHTSLAMSWYNTNGVAGSANEATAITVRNNSVYYAAAVNLATAAAQFSGFTTLLDSNAIRMAGTCSWFGWCIQSGANLTKLTSTKNSINGFGSGIWQLIASTFTNPTTETGLLTTDPIFTNGPAGDLTLQSGSPCIDSGSSWGQTQDYTGKAITGTPDRGAFER